MRHFIIVSHPLPGKADEFIGPFASAKKRDAECDKLTKKERKKTCAMVGRMTSRAISYYRTDVEGLVPGETAEKVAA